MRPRFPVLLFLVCVCLPAAGSSLLHHPRVIPTTGTPSLLLSGDFAGDAGKDLLVIDAEGKTLQVLVNQPGALFNAPIVTPVDVAIATAVTADVDADGRLDVLVGSYGQDSSPPKLRVYRGAGDGTFTVYAEVTGFSQVVALAVADFTGDGLMDLACRCYTMAEGVSRGVLLVYPGSGSSAFGSPIATSASEGRALEVLDANGDGKRDVLISGSPTELLLGNGAGSFTRSYFSYTTGGLAIGDFNEDGKQDFAISAGGTHDWYLEVHLGRGDGVFDAAGMYAVPYETSEVRAVDVDADGHLDLLTARGGGSLAVLRGNGSGSFSNPTMWDTQYFSFAAGDFDRNGTLDIVGIESYPTLVVSMLSGQGGGAFDGHRSFMPVKVVPVSYPGAYPYDARAVRINADSHPDVVVIVQRPFYHHALAVMLNDGSGVLGEATFLDYDSFGTSPGAFAPGDVNGDGLGDVVVVSSQSYGAATARTFLGRGDGTFLPPVVFAIAAGGEPKLYDMNADGKLDLLIDALDQVFIQNGAGDGSFGPPVSHNTVGFEGLGDVNGDGRVDIVGKMSRGTRVAINNGSGGFSISDIDDGDYSLLSGLHDLNGDGKLDLLQVLYDGIRVRLGAGDGTFASVVEMATPRLDLFFARFGVVDFDGDGILDFAVGGWLFRGAGDGRFHSMDRVRGYGGQTDVADFDGDGSPDLLREHQSDGTVSIVRTMTGSDPAVQPTLELTSSATTAEYAELVEFTATLSGGAVPFTGSVVFSRNGVPFAMQAVSGTSTIQRRVFPVGTGVVTATYSGDEVYRSAVDQVDLTVVRAHTSLEALSPPSVQCGGTLQVRIAFSGKTAFGQLPLPTGSLVFKAGTQLIKTSPLFQQSHSLSGIPQGTQVITASYAGDGNYEPSQTDFQVTVVPWNIAISASSGVFAGASGNFASLGTFLPPGAGFAWTIENGTIESGQGTRTIRYTSGATGEVRLQLTLSHSTVCSSVATASIPIVVRPANATMLYTVAPCRLFDTRDSSAIGGGNRRDVAAAGSCSIPPDARSIVATVTVVSPASAGWLSLFAADSTWPGTSTVNYRTGRTRANLAIVPLSSDGRVAVINQGPELHFIIDVTGYFR